MIEKESIENGDISGYEGGIPRFLSSKLDNYAKKHGDVFTPDTFLELRGGGEDAVRTLLDRASDGRWRGIISDDGRIVSITASTVEAQRLGEEIRSGGLERRIEIISSNELDEVFVELEVSSTDYVGNCFSV